MTYATMILLNLLLGGQPYSLTVTKVTPLLTKVCRLDPNCMDIEQIDEPDGYANNSVCRTEYQLDQIEGAQK